MQKGQPTLGERCKACQKVASLGIPPKIMRSLSSYLDVKGGISKEDKDIFTETFKRHIDTIFRGSKGIYNRIKNCALCVKLKNSRRASRNYKVRKGQSKLEKISGPTYYTKLFNKHKRRINEYLNKVTSEKRESVKKRKEARKEAKAKKEEAKNAKKAKKEEARKAAEEKKAAKKKKNEEVLVQPENAEKDDETILIQENVQEPKNVPQDEMENPQPGMENNEGQENKASAEQNV